MEDIQSDNQTVGEMQHERIGLLIKQLDRAGWYVSRVTVDFDGRTRVTLDLIDRR